VTNNPTYDPAGIERLSRGEKRALLARILRKKSRAVSTNPMSLGQKALYLLHLTAPQSPAYNMAMAVRIRARGDSAALRRACQLLLARHPCLRSRFAVRDGHAVQEIDAYQEVRFEHRELFDADLDHIRKVLCEESQRPFDLKNGPVFRVMAVSRSERDHILLLCVHHTVCDGWSFWVLLDELRVLYTAALTGTARPLAPLSNTYADFVHEQAAMLAGEGGRRLSAYWMQRLAGAQFILDLPTDRARPPVQTLRGSSCRFLVSTDLLHRLRSLSRHSRVTLFMTMLTAFQVLLHRYTGQDDFLIGTATAGRSRPEFTGIVGYFINPVVLRADLCGDPSFQELLHRTQRVVAEALVHQDYPFPLLVQQLQPTRDPSRSPLFQVLFNWQKPPRQAHGDSTTPVELFDVPGREGQFDLSLEIGEAPNELCCTFRYSTDLFDFDTIERMAKRFIDLLQQGATAPHEPVSAIRLLPVAEERLLVVDWNNTDIAYPVDQCLHHLIEAQADRNPKAPAVWCDDVELSYGELNRNANVIAQRLSALGVGPEVLVGLYLHPSIEQIEALLAVLKAGGAYLPLDITDPSDRLTKLLQDANPQVVITTRSLAGKLNGGTAAVLCVDEQQIDASHASGIGPRATVGPRNLAYAIYTSGSTGAPKAVLVEHRQIVNYTLAVLDRLEFSKLTRFALLQSINWDGGLTILFPALCSGGQVHIISRERSCDPRTLAAYIRRHDIQCLKITPSHLAALETHGGGEALLPSECLVLGGEPSSFDWVKQICSRNPSCRVVNHYGPTEATVGALVYCVTLEAPSRPAITPLGRPLPNVRAYVLDPGLRICPIDVPGELYLGGAGITRGYLNRPALTAENFIPDPFRPTPGARLYRTGDFARYLPDGNIEFLGRTDTQVKLRGIRIEPAQIEAVLRQHVELQDAAVIVREDQDGQKQLVAYIVPRQLGSVSPITVRQYARSRLPAYMVPAMFVLLDGLPLTASGKLNRSALPPPTEILERSRSRVPPRGQTERLIGTLWEDALKFRPIAIDDNFFDLGGHSLLLIGVHDRLQEQLGRDIPLVTLFSHPTVRSLAAHLDGVPDETDGTHHGLARAHARLGATILLEQRRTQRLAFRDVPEETSS
jgi:amino acid adenylation domain-containing protein